MKFRKLRIACSGVCGIACVLLIALWVRSYPTRTSTAIFVTPTDRYYIHSLSGTLAFEKEQRVFIEVEVVLVHEESDFFRLKTNAGLRILRDNSNGKAHAISISYWLLLIVAVCIGILPWLPWSNRFSLRTLLIATTLVAVVLAIIIYFSR